MARLAGVPVTTLSKPGATRSSTDGSRRRRNPLTSFLRTSSPSKSDTASAPVPKSIHALLGCELQAYAVFKPRMSDLFDLFHILHITDGSDSNRHKSPVYTFANFKTICEQMRADVHDGDPEILDLSVLDRLCEEMKNVELKDKQEFPILGIATASSVENAVSFSAGIGVPSTISVGTTLTNTQTALREFSLSVTKTEKYCGGNKLNKLIWKHGEALFVKILEELGGDGNIDTMGVGHRKLIAIVTKKIIADINIARERTYVREFGSHAGGAEGTFNILLNVNKSRLQRDNSHHEGGITGIHFIEFPMERIDDFRFRFRPGINVGPVGDDDLDDTNPDAFYRYKRWLAGKAEGDDGVNPPSSKHVDGNHTHSRFQEASVIKEKGHVATSGSEVEVKHIDCSLALDRLALEVDLTARLYEFSMNLVQRGRECYDRAQSQCSSVNDDLLARSVNFFRSALRTVCYEATLCGLDGLSTLNRGSCEEKKRMEGRLLRYCLRTLRQGEECWEVWKRLLELRRELIEDPEPEMRIADTICLFSIGPRRLIWDIRGDLGRMVKFYEHRQTIKKRTKLDSLEEVSLVGSAGEGSVSPVDSEESQLAEFLAIWWGPLNALGIPASLINAVAESSNHYTDGILKACPRIDFGQIRVAESKSGQEVSSGGSDTVSLVVLPPDCGVTDTPLSTTELNDSVQNDRIASSSGLSDSRDGLDSLLSRIRNCRLSRSNSISYEKEGHLPKLPLRRGESPTSVIWSQITRHSRMTFHPPSTG